VSTDALCSALFREARGPGVRVASFSDYFCPYCRVLTQELAQREAAGRISVAWHELPLLSEASEVAAKAALAAERQGGYAAFHARLMRARFEPTPAYLAEIARSAGLEAERLLTDMDSVAVRAQLAESAAVAARFGFIGTPALVIGRTVVVGTVSPARLDQLIAAEAEEGPGRCR
jgi:protein-disulfide isomerase